MMMGEACALIMAGKKAKIKSGTALKALESSRRRETSLLQKEDEGKTCAISVEVWEYCLANIFNCKLPYMRLW
ncbi:hypothetical protein [Pontibacter cellulosilyticus]|uniref:Uncharacterized protein n=1 Tax=Pontibacter cellulosilyticus TaxID=1720253 RepID=A0A923SP04_9BACT|nr:hypothetical protein [Pontibacter cellulosilyticus]MBC5993700.1 hypothetical protein [Pontibacter cellulosilyticus]